MTALFAHQLQLQLSGGAANAQPEASLGGVRSGTPIAAQTFSTANAIQGVTLVSCQGLRPDIWDLAGTRQLEYLSASGMLQFRDIDSVTYPGTLITNPADRDGFFEVRGGGGNEAFARRLVVNVIRSLLPASDTVDPITGVATNTRNLFDDVQKSQISNGFTDYRCVYVYNPSTTDTAVNVRVQLNSTQEPQAEGSQGAPLLTPLEVRLALDPAGVGDGVATGVSIGPLADETDPGTLLGVLSFTSLDQTIGDLAPETGAAFWVRRVVPTGTIVESIPDVHGLIALKTTVP